MEKGSGSSLLRFPCPREDFFCCLGLILSLGGESERGPLVHREQSLPGVQKAKASRFEAEMRTYGREGSELLSHHCTEAEREAWVGGKG